MCLLKGLKKSLKRHSYRAKTNKELQRAKEAAVRRYRNYPNVVGISAVTKYQREVATTNHASIHFYVKEKVSRRRFKGRMLPRFVYGRFKNGKINRKVRFFTDVIRVGSVRQSVDRDPLFHRVSVWTFRM